MHTQLRKWGVPSPKPSNWLDQQGTRSIYGLISARPSRRVLHDPLYSLLRFTLLDGATVYCASRIPFHATILRRDRAKGSRISANDEARNHVRPMDRYEFRQGF